jgi:hypothetical protein
MRNASQHSREATGKYALRKGSMVLLNVSFGFAHSLSPIVQQYLANLSIVLFIEFAREMLILPSDAELSILDRALKISIDCAKFSPFQSFNLLQVWDMQFIDATESSFLKERLLSIQRDDLIAREFADAMSLAGTWNHWWPCDEFAFEDVRIRAMKSSLKQRHFSFQHLLKNIGSTLFPRDSDEWQTRGLNLPPGRAFHRLRGFEIDAQQQVLRFYSRNLSVENRRYLHCLIFDLFWKMDFINQHSLLTIWVHLSRMDHFKRCNMPQQNS